MSLGNINGISVIICCHNGSKRLPLTLKHLSQQKINEVSCEVILVDNASTDDTASLASELWDKFQVAIPLLIVKEAKPGLAYARAKGLGTSQYDLIVFCDDDNHLQQDYLRVSHEIATMMPEVAIIGGLNKPRIEIEEKGYFNDVYPALAISNDPDKHDGYTSWVFGAGMVIRKKIYNEIEQKGIVLYLTGREGKKQTSGEDAELCIVSRYLGYKIYYSSKLVLYHAVDEYRLRKRNFIKTSHQNFSPTLYLYLLEKWMNGKYFTKRKMLFNFIIDRVKKIFYYAPRTVLSRHKFFSFWNLYGTIIFLKWISFNYKTFYKLHALVQRNMNDGTRLQ